MRDVIDMVGKRTLARYIGVAVALCIMFTSAIVFAQNFARGYATEDQELRPGMAVALSASSTAETPMVERADQDNLEKLIGVATDAEENLVTLGSGKHQAYVQNSGTVTAFASNVNGEIKKGDELTLSPIKGVLMRASEENSGVAAALEDFVSADAESHTITTKDGERSVLVGKLAMSLANSLSGGQNTEGKNKTQLEILGKSITGKDVGAIQVAAALVIFLVVIVAEGAIIYGAVSSSIISLGRNPFSKGIIRLELVRVLGLVLVVLVVGLAAIYALLGF